MNEIQHPSGDGTGPDGERGPSRELEITPDGAASPNTVMEQALKELNRPDFSRMSRAKISDFWDRLSAVLDYGDVFPQELLWLLIQYRQAADETARGTETRRQAEVSHNANEDPAAVEKDGEEERHGD